MKRILLSFSLFALVLAGVASASRDTGVCSPAGQAIQGHAQQHGQGEAHHGPDGGCCAKMADGKGCCTPDADGKKGSCADGTCEMKKQNANGETTGGCCEKKAGGEAKAGCCAKTADGEAKAGCCTKQAPQGARS